MTTHFTPLADDDLLPFPGAFTKLHAGARQVQEGDIISIVWHMPNLDQGDTVTGKVSSIDFVEHRGKLELITKLALEEGWYTHGLDSVLTPVPGSAEDEGDSVLSFKPKVMKSARVGRWELSTHDRPGWDIFILGAESEERKEFLRRRIQV